MDRISPNFIYAFILPTSTLGLLHIIFCTYVPELWPLIYSKISFTLNIMRTNGQILTKLFITIYTDKIYVGIVNCHFSHICTSVMTLYLRQISFQFNILRTDGQNFTKFYICIHIDKIYVGIVTYHFSHICNRVKALDFLQKLVSDQYLENKWTDFDQTLYNNILYSQMCKRVLALDEVRITLPLNILRHSGLLLHARHCSGAIVRFSDNSSYDRYSLG